MQDIEHTPEPWTMGKPPYHGNEIHGVDRADGSRQLVAQVYGYSEEEVVANMRRITVCVNACAGIPTETLEAGGVMVPVDEYRYLAWVLEEYAEAEDRMGNYDEKRDEMLRIVNARLRQYEEGRGC